MGFADRNAAPAWRERLGSGVAVLALHAGLGAALLATFAGGAITAVIKDTFIAQNWTYVPPPQPMPTASPSPHARHDDRIVTPPPRGEGLTNIGPMLDTRPIDLGDLPPLDFGAGGDSALVVKPTPHPSPTYAPLLARPRNDPASWVTRNDYPTQAIREGWTGVTRFRLAIGADGRVTDCTVTASSGHDLLDQIACARVASRAHFTPARDETGAAAAGIFQSAIRWQLED